MTPRDDYSSPFLGREVKVVIDRPLGSRHPTHNVYYPVNYGHVPNTKAPDGAELDAYVLGVFEPIGEFSGDCIGIIRRSDDDDDKLVVVPSGISYSDEQIIALTEFQERFFSSRIVRARRSAP